MLKVSKKITAGAMLLNAVCGLQEAAMLNCCAGRALTFFAAGGFVASKATSQASESTEDIDKSKQLVPVYFLDIDLGR